MPTPNDAVIQSQEELDTIARLQAGIAAFNLKQFGAAEPTPIQIAWNRIKTERDRRIQQGGYKVGTKWYHSDTFSRTQQMGLVMLGANIPANTPWKTMDGSFVIMTQTLAGQIFAAAAASDIAIFTAAEAHRTAMEASQDPASYNFASGWPSIYGE